MFEVPVHSQGRSQGCARKTFKLPFSVFSFQGKEEANHFKGKRERALNQLIWGRA